jgi:hypothetical protein
VIEAGSDRVASWLRGRSPRERAGLAILAAAASISLALSAHDAATHITRDAAELRRAAGEALAARARAEDGAYQADLKANADRAMALTIREASEGVGRARAVSIVRALALEAGFGNVVVAPGQVQREGTVSVTLSADFTWTSLAAFLEALGNSDVAFGVEAIAVQPASDDTKTMEMTLRAAFVRTGGSA